MDFITTVDQKYNTNLPSQSTQDKHHTSHHLKSTTPGNQNKSFVQSEVKLRSISTKKNSTRLHQIRHQYENFRQGILSKMCRAQMNTEIKNQNSKRQANSTGRHRPKLNNSKEPSIRYQTSFARRIGYRTNRNDVAIQPQFSK
jgi:hypothetical protein